MQTIAKNAMLATMPTAAIIPMSRSEACDMLGVSRDTLIRMIAAGKIKRAVKFPGPSGAYVLDRAEVEKLRDELAAKAGAS